MLVRVKNPAGRKKAVRSAGGFVVIGVGKTETLDASKWADGERARYEAAGLVISSDGEEPTETAVDDQERKAIIVTLIENLPAGAVTKDGKPEVDAINELLPMELVRVTAKERDEIWAELQAGSTE
jgi:hypothetical protein